MRILDGKTQDAKPGLSSRIVWVLFFVAVTAVSLVFRSYELIPKPDIPETQKRALAENFVQQSLQKQILTQMHSSGSQIPEAMRSEFASQQVAAIIKTDRSKYEDAVKKFMASVSQDSRGASQRRYLLESDPYHFMGQVEKILETGRVSDRIENGKFLDRMRCYPHGQWVAYGAQPWVGVLVYRAANLLKPGLGLMEALGYVPLVLVVLVLASFFFLCRTLDFGPVAASAAALSVSLAPIYLQRSSYGWFDTDPYNLLFPNLILGLFFLALPSTRKRSLLLGAAAGASTGIYVLFWIGWPFIFLIVSGVSLFLIVKHLLGKDPMIQGSRFFLPAYWVSTLAAGITAAGPGTFSEFIVRGAKYVGAFASLEPNTWPNVFLMVGETTSVTPIRLIYLTGNFVTCVIMAAGILSILWIKREASLKVFTNRWWALLLLTAPLLILAAGTERFTVLLVTPLALFLGLAVETLGRGAAEKIRGAGAGTSALKSLVMKRAGCLWGLAVFTVILPLQLIFAHALALKSEPIMNDTWYSAMEVLRDKTPDSAVVYSWWPPGYFISALGRRPVFADGGTQELPGSYWLARIFMATREEEALGIMRMLNSSGAQAALDVLKGWGIKTASAMDLLNSILPLEPGEAKLLLEKNLDPQRAESLLRLTHLGTYQVPSFLFVYSEMVEKNLAMSVFARWNFHKAAVIQKAASQSRGVLGVFRSNRSESIRQFIASSESVLRYLPEAKLERREGSRLIFGNGVIVDWESKKALISRPAEGVQGQVSRLFYLEDSQLKEAGGGASSTLDISVLVFEKEGNLAAVIADPDLIRSLLFRLYYLRGASLRHFRPVFENTGESPAMTVQVFETLWPTSNPETNPAEAK